MIMEIMQTICTVEGSVGSNIYLGMYRTTHIFRDGTLNVVLLSPLSEYFHDVVRNLMFEFTNTIKAAFVIMSLMWSFTPATCLLQLSVLSRQSAHWSPFRKLVSSFAFTVVCLIFVGFTIPMIMPSRKLALLMEKSMKELFKIPDEQFVQTYGISITHADINDGKSMLIFILMFAVIPYLLSYTIIVITIRKSILPLVILSIPVSIATYGTVLNADLGLATLPLTAFVWLCPVAQVTNLSHSFHHTDDDTNYRPQCNFVMCDIRHLLLPNHRKL
ncbi:hypothetical protein PRIPAC_77793 [Pristionchus pacificus]|uniref:Uncharacterized protein n=1 Tax=Pristionchus pacificus TaxID=54126 RepID=A0A2A6C1Y0_PRIPA|nr:hypothetical protein PRIPAC_77793 [Pristionchus pacificus]|eukprot:PDM72150.1 hypothetical protein PRIPAC_38584 [Pristionchus pacificus]